MLAALALATSIQASAAALSTNARMAIPYEVQQIIQVDYRALNSSQAGLALKNKVMPEQLKTLEESLRKAGLNDTEDVDNLTFALFRGKANGLYLVGIAQGNIPERKLLATMKKRKVKPTKYRDSQIYPLTGSSFAFSMLDDSTMLFGDQGAVKQALDARDGETRNVNYNSAITDQLASVSSEPIWSILDAAGTQNMVKSALGEASGLADYETVKKRLLGSHYVMDFNSGVKFKLDVKSSDSFTASTLSSLMRAGALYKRMGATGAEKSALDSMTIDSSGSDLLVKFESDDQKFMSLLNSPMFQAVSR